MSCTSPKINEQVNKPIEKTKIQRLELKADLYKSLQPSALDENGWPHKCDAVGFLALCKAAGNCENANFFDAEESAGKWQRNKEHNCVETGGSKTSISKDMLMMGFYYGLFKMEKETAKGYFNRLEKYGRDHDWIMGYPSETLGDLGRVYMTPPMIATLYNIIEKVSGTKPLRSRSSRIMAPTGYQAHLRVLDILIQAKLKGGIDVFQMTDLDDLHNRNPKNALYQIVFHRFKDGDLSEATDILLDEKLFPSDRLPTSSDRCDGYLWQRENGKDWQPCDEGVTHDGIDFMFAYYLLGVK